MATRINPYKDVHKGIRKILLDLLLQCGQTDFDEKVQLTELHKRFVLVHDLLEMHSEIENTLLSPLVQASCPPEVLAEIESAHDYLHGVSTRLARQLDSFLQETVPAGEGQRFYLSLSSYVGEQLQHMAAEEEIAWPYLSRQCDDASMLQLQMQARKMMPPVVMQALLKAMMPAINTAERCTMLSGMRSALSEDAFTRICALAREVLPEDDWSNLNRRLGLESAA